MHGPNINAWAGFFCSDNFRLSKQAIWTNDSFIKLEELIYKKTFVRIFLSQKYWYMELKLFKKTSLVILFNEFIVIF